MQISDNENRYRVTGVGTNCFASAIVNFKCIATSMMLRIKKIAHNKSNRIAFT